MFINVIKIHDFTEFIHDIRSLIRYATFETDKRKQWNHVLRHNVVININVDLKCILKSLKIN